MKHLSRLNIQVAVNILMIRVCCSGFSTYTYIRTQYIQMRVRSSILKEKIESRAMTNQLSSHIFLFFQFYPARSCRRVAAFEMRIYFWLADWEQSSRSQLCGSSNTIFFLPFRLIPTPVNIFSIYFLSVFYLQQINLASGNIHIHFTPIMFHDFILTSNDGRPQKLSIFFLLILIK